MDEKLILKMDEKWMKNGWKMDEKKNEKLNID